MSVELRPDARLRSPHLPVVQELLIAATRGEELTFAELTARGGQRIFAGEAVEELEARGYVEQRRESARRVLVVVRDAGGLADLLAGLSAWPGTSRQGGRRLLAVGYLWGRNSWDIAARLTRNAEAADVPLAVTGRTGAAFYGIAGPSSRIQVRCWAVADRKTATVMAGRLGLEEVPEREANVLVAADPWRLGTGGAGIIRSGKCEASVAHPARVWCDLHGEDGGRELAAGLRARTRQPPLT